MHTNGYTRAILFLELLAQEHSAVVVAAARSPVHRCCSPRSGSGQRSGADDDPDDEARVLDALAASPSDPDTLALRLGLSTTALAAIVARLMSRGKIDIAGDGRLARK